MTNARTTDVCVIGGGLLGTATALFAARAGLTCTVVERGDLAAGASGAAFGGVSVGIYSYSSARVPESYVRLSQASLDLYHRLSEELGPPLDFDAPGSLDPFFDPATSVTRRERVEGLNACGVPCELLSAAEVRKLEPALSPKIAGATYCPVDGHVTPMNVVWAMALAARSAGVKFLTDTPVDTIVYRDGEVKGVRTARGEISAGWIVNTAGVGAPGLSSQLGVHIPMDSTRGQMFVTERIPPLLNTYVHNIKQTRSGTIVFGATRESGTLDVGTTVEGAKQVVNWAVGVVPPLADVRILRSWAGIRPVPADGYPVIGRVDGVDRFLVAVMHRGVTFAPLIGKILVDLIVEGETDLDISPYQLSRFADAAVDDEVIVEETYYAER